MRVKNHKLWKEQGEEQRPQIENLMVKFKEFSNGSGEQRGYFQSHSPAYGPDVHSTLWNKS